jgi:hypothetical protein
MNSASSSAGVMGCVVWLVLVYALADVLAGA